MLIKDYYNILQVTSSATGEEIKKAYRKLAQQYHPDKTQNDAYATERFSAIKEAYEVLSNPLKKEHYQQQRWYARSAGIKRSQEPVTPVTLLKRSLDLDQYVSRLDVHRMDKHGLNEHLHTLISGDHISLLNGFQEKTINNEVALLVIKIAASLPYRWQVRVHEKLHVLDVDDEISTQMKTALFTAKRAAFWEKQKIWVVILAVAAICLLIFLTKG